MGARFLSVHVERGPPPSPVFEEMSRPFVFGRVVRTFCLSTEATSRLKWRPLMG